jgi:hypothetical protein
MHIYYSSIHLLTIKQKDYQVPVPKTDHTTYEIQRQTSSPLDHDNAAVEIITQRPSVHITHCYQYPKIRLKCKNVKYRGRSDTEMMKKKKLASFLHFINLNVFKL